ncbi:DUF5077 domain-containing protein [Mucilaginibacter calamicampi]|uniref:DUF5077 domain-containing protein n=1 Tax=Mucilaginibacter calamicampi TaxID=1302352 RepID=A0ABW2YVJ4_9SPHI
MQTIVLSAARAAVNGALKIMSTPLPHTLHYWNNTNDTITWNCEIPQPGKYLIKLNYSLDKHLTGGIVQIAIGEQSITFETSTTDSWLHFREVDAGVISIEQTGRLSVELKGVKLPVANDSAFPDIHTVSLVLTDCVTE